MGEESVVLKRHDEIHGCGFSDEDGLFFLIGELHAL